MVERFPFWGLLNLAAKAKCFTVIAQVSLVR